MATFLQPLGILLRNHLSKYNIKYRSCTDKLIRIHHFLSPDHQKKELHSLCINCLNQLKVEDLARPACGNTFFARSMAQYGVDAKKLETSTELAEFDALFPELVDELTKNQIKNPDITDAFLRFKEVLHYNVPSGKKLKGLSVVTSYKHLASEASEADLKIARVLGWCVELDKVGLTAINDAFFLESCVYSLLRKYIRDKPYYLSIMELFQQTTLQTVTGQCLDLTKSESKGDFSQFTMETFNAMAKWKTTFFVFYFPVLIAMHLNGDGLYLQQRTSMARNAEEEENVFLDCTVHHASDFGYGKERQCGRRSPDYRAALSETMTAGVSDEETLKQAKTILIQIGQFHQARNDYLDCYGAFDVTRKFGNDIEENKCSWLIVKALEIASDEQKEELRRNYGKCVKEAVEKVKAIYRDLKLEDVYKQYEESSYQDISNCINSLDCAVPKEVFLDFISTNYTRDK